MKSANSTLSRNHRTAAAMTVLYEAGEVGSLERARLFQAIWNGWREVMCIRLAALLLVEHQGPSSRPPG